MDDLLTDLWTTTVGAADALSESIRALRRYRRAAARSSAGDTRRMEYTVSSANR